MIKIHLADIGTDCFHNRHNEIDFLTIGFLHRDRFGIFTVPQLRKRKRLDKVPFLLLFSSPLVTPSLLFSSSSSSSSSLSLSPLSHIYLTSATTERDSFLYFLQAMLSQQASQVTSGDIATIRDGDSLASSLASLVFDYVVVGGGSAGCVIANRLSKDPNVSVCLLEAGPEDDVNPDIQRADKWFSLLGDPKMHWPGFETVPQPGLNGRSIDLCQARVLGGCGAHNASFYVRGSSLDYDRWESKLGCDGWSWSRLLPFFKELETFEEEPKEDGDEQLKSSKRGNRGEFDVRRPKDLSTFSKSVVHICEESLGIPAVRDYNDGEQQLGISPVQFNVRDNQRQSAYHRFIMPVLKQRNNNLRVISSAQVERILFEGNRAVGVKLLNDTEEEGSGHDDKRVIRARRDVVLTAGAYNTPKLLLLSGIGDSKHLSDHGIPVVAEVPGVGSNLSDHLWTLLRLFVGEEDSWIDNEATKDWMQLHGFGSVDGDSGDNRDTTSNNESDIRDRRVPDFQYLFLCRDTLLEGLALPEVATKQPKKVWVMAAAALHPTSRGTVRLQSSDARQSPVVDPQYVSTEKDMQTWRKIASKCSRLAKEIVKRHPSKQIIPEGDDDNDRDLQHVLATASTMWHPVGTCKMGDLSKDPTAVVDASTMKVRGVEGLRVADASVIPEIPSGNTNVPTMAVAARAATLILATHKSK